MSDHDPDTTLRPSATGSIAYVIDRATVTLLTLAAGFTVANNYYNQALLGHLSEEFDLSAPSASAIPVATQLGNGVGILLLGPLGDRLERRSLIVAMTVALAAALMVMATAQSVVWLVVASALIGLCATVTIQIISIGVQLAASDQRGRVLGTITSGVLIGILLARTVSGVITDLCGWRSVFWAAAGSVSLTAAGLAMTLPRSEALTRSTYTELLGSLWRLWRAQQILRSNAITQALLFAAFSAFWSNLALVLAAAPYHLGATAVGTMALVGVFGSLAAPLAGRITDRRGPKAIVRLGAGLVVAAFALLGIAQGSLAAMVAGIFLLDIGVQTSHVANQARVQALDSTARSRLNTVFMAVMILGGALGAGGAGFAYSCGGWSATCVLGATLGLLAAIVQARLNPGPGLDAAAGRKLS